MDEEFGMMNGLCLRCGHEKPSAWSPCPSCEHHPIEPDDRARHYLVLEQLVDPVSRDAVIDQIVNHHELTFDEENVTLLAAELGEESLLEVAAFGLLLGLLPLLGLAIIVVFGIWWMV